MPPSRRVLYPDLELAQPFRVAVEHPREPQLLQLLLQTGGKTRVHAAAARQNNGLEERGPDVDVGRLDRVEQKLAQAGLLAVDEVRLEEALRRFEAFASDANDATVGEGVAFYKNRRVLAQPLVELKVVRNVTELLLDLPDRLKVGRSVKGVAPAQEERDEVAGHVSPSHVQAAGEVVEDDRVVDGDDMSDAVSRVDDDAGT